MDEPLSNLDAKLRTHTRTELKALQRELGTTTIFVTHDQAEAMTMADRIAILDLGVLQQLGSPDDVYRHPANLFVAQFIGSPPMNILDGERADGALLVAGGWRIPAPTIRADRGAALKVGLRPEAIALSNEAGGGVAGEVLVSEPLGSEVIVNVKLGETLLKVRTAPEVRPEPGSRVWLSAQREDVRVFDASSGAALV
jgi:multiple sugar transport system ATP-binding protein